MENTDCCLSREPDPEREVPRLRGRREVDPAQVLLRGLSAGGRLRGGQSSCSLRSVYTKCQHQRKVNAAMTLMICSR